jgi:hypothetical protein
VPKTPDVVTLDKQALASFVEKFVREFERISGRQLMIYTSAGFWNTYMPITGWAKVHPLWVACWTTASQPTIPNEWKPPANPNGYPPEFWQYSANGNNLGKIYGVSSRDIDTDRWWGGTDEASFNAKYGTHIIPLPGDTPPPVIEFPHGLHFTSATVNNSVNVRTTPSAVNNNNLVGAIKYPAKPIAFEEKVLDAKTKWVRIGSNIWCIQTLSGKEILSYD